MERLEFWDWVGCGILGSTDVGRRLCGSRVFLAFFFFFRV